VSANVPAFVYFNNDIGGHAPRDARMLVDLLSRRKDLDRSGVNRHIPVAIG
jgi:uncharacterized protein YecE (DUF72 family)